MAILSGPQNAGIVGYKQISTVPKVTVGPQNVGLPGYRPGDPGVGYGAATGYVAPAAPVAPPPPAPPPPPPPPPLDFKKLTEGDAEYIGGKALLARNNDLATQALKLAFARNSQGSQDSFNQRGALFSGAALNAQNSIRDANVQAGLRQQLDYDQGGHNLYHSVFNRLTQQLGGVQ